ncbi:MAG: M56 family metallopeptidase, partial [Acutalibacteraceae bacterium]
FVLGIIKPKIYLPFNVEEHDIGHIIAHEQAHIKRKDHWWKPLGFLLLAIHWFNPLLWLSYVLLCRDIELACDEKVVRELNNEQRTDYSQALLTSSINRRMIAACPLAFGAVGVKTRVKSVLNYKKPAFWIIAVAVTVSIVLAVCFLTNPVSKKLKNIENLSLDSITESTVYVLVSDGEIYNPIGAVSEDLLQNLSNIKISRRELSNNRSEDRDMSHTLVLQNEQDTEATISSYFLKGTYIHFNSDFTTVWVNTGVKPTLSYKVINPQAAKKIYNCICKYIDVTADDSSISEIPYTHWSYFKKVLINYDPDISLDEEDLGLTPDVDDTNEHYEVMAKMDIEYLRAKFPMYFYLPASNGLEVYIWQMDNGSYSCGLLPANNQNYTQEELWNLTPASIVEMKAIVFCYLSSGIDPNDIAICPIQTPTSSYAYNIDNDYREKITKLFWSSGFPPMDLTSISSTIDTAIFDIDGDGKDETCTLNYGPTSGLFTFTLAAYEDGELEYFNIFNSPCLDLSFTKSADGKTILCGKDGEHTRYMGIDVDNENIVISCDEEDISYWGEQGINSPYAPYCKRVK